MTLSYLREAFAMNRIYLGVMMMLAVSASVLNEFMSTKGTLTSYEIGRAHV